MKRTLEKITRRILPLVIAANITPAINSGVSYGQECGESFETENMNDVKTEYTLQCNFNGKDRVWTYVDPKGVVRESNRQTWPQTQYNKEVKSEQPTSRGIALPIPLKQVVPLAPEAPSQKEQSDAEAERLKVAAEQRAKEEQEKAKKAKFDREEAERRRVADAEVQAALKEKKAEKKKENDSKGTETAEIKGETEKSTENYEGKTIYDFAVDTPKANIYSEREFVSLNLAGEYSNFVKDKRENTVKGVASAFASIEFGRFLSIGPFVRIYDGEIKNRDSSSKTLSSQRELVGSGIYRQVTNNVEKIIDREYGSLEAGLGATVKTENFRFLLRLGGINRKETTTRNYDTKVTIDSNGTPIGNPITLKKATYDPKKETVLTGEVGIEYKLRNGVSVGVGTHVINGEDPRGKLSLNYNYKF